MSEIQVRKTRPIDVDGKSYILTALKGRLAYRYMNKIIQSQESGTQLSEEDIVVLICESLGIKEDKFDNEFSGRMTAMFQIIEEIIDFNYSDVFQKGVSEEKAE